MIYRDTTKPYLASTLPAKCVAEFIGTFFLMTSVGISVHSESIGGALAVGGMFCVMIYALGSVSGGHLNPAVTLAIWLAGRRKITAWQGAWYVIFQVLGGVCAALFTWALAKEGNGSGFVLPGPGTTYGSDHAIAVEILYTMMLCYVVLNVATTETKLWGSAPNANFGFAIGMAVTAAAIAIGPISGCSLNPALAIGSAVGHHMFHGKLASWTWAAYVLSPTAGAFAGALAFWLVRGGLFTRYEYEPEYKKFVEEPVEVIIEKVEEPVPPPPRPVPPPPPPAPAPPPKPAAKPKDIVSYTPRTPHHGEKAPSTIFLERSRPLILPPEAKGNELHLTVKWSVEVDSRQSPRPCDIDLTCVKFGKAGDSLGAVYFAKTGDFGIRHSGDSVGAAEGKRTQSGSDGESESIILHLNEIKPNVHALIFVVMIYSGETFDDCKKYTMLLHDKSTGKDVCCYQKRRANDGANSQLAAMLWRSGNEWHFKAVDETHTVPANSSYRKLMIPMQKHVTNSLGMPSSSSMSPWMATRSASGRSTPSGGYGRAIEDVDREEKQPQHSARTPRSYKAAGQ
jgi:aquaporin Z